MNELNETPLDDLRDRMVCALYGELDGPELQTLHATVKNDPELQAEWRELQSMRHMLRIAGAAPVDEVPTGSTAPPSRPIRRVLASISSNRLAASGLGFAAAATLFVALLLGGLRVDRTPNGWLVRLDGSIASDLAVASALSAGDPSQMRHGVSHAEMAELTRVFAGATAARLDQLERRQVESQAGMTRALYDALLVHQQQQYADLRNRIERVGYTAGATLITGSRGPTGQIIRGGMNHDN